MSDQERLRLFNEAMEAFSAAERLAQLRPVFGTPEWETWRALANKATEAHDAYLKYVGDDDPTSRLSGE